MGFPYFKQHDAMDCGPTCLRMVAKSHGRNISLQTLREKTEIGKEGVNLLGISQAAEFLGFRTQSVKIQYESLVRDSSLPVILHWNQNHFVVLYKVKRQSLFNRNETLFIADPARGLMTFNPQEFKAKWESGKSQGVEHGIALLLEPSPLFFDNQDEIEEKKAQGGLWFKNIFSYVLPYKKLVSQLIIGLGVATLLQLFLPFLTQSVVDVGVNTGNIHFVYIILLAQLALFTGRLVIEFVRGWILLHISTRINISILTDFLIKLMKLPVSFFDSKHTGDILQRMNDHSRIENFLTGSTLNVLFSLLNLVIFSIILAIFNSSIFIVFLISSVLYGAWVIVFLKRRKVLDYKRFDVASKEQGVTIQLVQGMQEIKLNGVEKSMRWTWEGLQAKLFKLNMKGLALNQWQQAGAFFINEGKNIFITFLSAKAVIDGQMTLGAMLAVQYIIGQLNSPIQQMIGFVQSWQNAKISMDRLNEIHTIEDEEPVSMNFQQELPPGFAKKLAGGREPEYVNEYENAYNSHTLVDLHGEHSLGTRSKTDPFFEDQSYQYQNSIIFKNVSFTYPGAGNEPVLKDIDLVIPKGKVTAIVGVSGSGKTTLLKLLLKFYEPQRGEIKLNNTSLSTISHRVWRKHWGVVMQESFIFSDTIAKNIAVGEERIDWKRLERAVEVANIKDFIDELPLRYNTKIGMEGAGISMGQKQRMLIARAVYRDPDFIMLDEATNSLDANNESAIVNNLNRFLSNRTVVVVAHRLSTVKNASQIVVLDKGRITEKGTHQQLIALRGAYYTLVKNQLELGE